MNARINDLLRRIRLLEEEIQDELVRQSAGLHADFAGRRIRFEQELLEAHRRLRQGLVHYLLTARPLVMLTAPVIYGLLPVLFLLDACITLYQWTCFPVYGIPGVKRSGHFVFDRAHLAYLNALEKLHCAYCSYANGLFSYAREIGARTEQYWCPIKHARRLADAHARYPLYQDYGDALAWREELDALRKKLAEKPSGEGTPPDTP